MHPDVEALVALQADDTIVQELEERLASLEPRLQALERQQAVAREALDRARQALEVESGRVGETRDRVTQARTLQDRSQSQLEHVTSAREAAAAMAQSDAARRLASTAEGELTGVQRRMEQLREQVAQAEKALVELEQAQEAERADIAARRRDLEEELRHARMKREGASHRVPRPLLGKYDRIRHRVGATAVFPLRGGSCGNCDTTLPVQRQREMRRTGGIETCEACGVLLYAAD